MSRLYDEGTTILRYENQQTEILSDIYSYGLVLLLHKFKVKFFLIGLEIKKKMIDYAILCISSLRNADPHAGRIFRSIGDGIVFWRIEWFEP